MSAETAKMMVMIGVAVGVLFWVLGLILFLKVKAAPSHLKRRLGTLRKSPEETIDLLIPLAGARGRVVERTDRSLSVDVVKAVLVFRIESDTSGEALHVEAGLRRFSTGSTVGLALFTFVLQPIAIIAAAVLIMELAVPHKNPAVRGQAAQMFQIIHFLWPPFLIAHIHNRNRRAILALADEARVALCTP